MKDKDKIITALATKLQSIYELYNDLCPHEYRFEQLPTVKDIIRQAEQDAKFEDDGPDDDHKESLLPLKYWSQLGFKVKKGSVAVDRCDGVALFSRDQVERPEWFHNTREYTPPQNYRVDGRQEEACELAEEYGDDAYMLGGDF